MTFPTTDMNELGNMRVRRMEDATLHYYELSASFDYPGPQATYPQYRSTKHMLCVLANGVPTPISEYADNAARIAAGLTCGLVNLCSFKKKQRAAFIQKATSVAFELMAPQTLATDEVYVHPAVDAATSKLHPFKVVVNNDPNRSIARIMEPPRESPTSVVWAHFTAEVLLGIYTDSAVS